MEVRFRLLREKAGDGDERAGDDGKEIADDPAKSILPCRG